MVVDFIFNTVGLKSNFINLSYEVPDEYTYSWDFGDGETSTELNPTHEYQKMGFIGFQCQLLIPIIDQ